MKFRRRLLLLPASLAPAQKIISDMTHTTPSRFKHIATSALAAALLTLGALPAASAQIVYTAPVDLTLTTAVAEGGAYLLFGFGTGGSGGSARIGSDFRLGDNFLFLTIGSPNFIAAAVGVDDIYNVEGDANRFSANLAPGAPIDGSHTSFASSGFINWTGANDANWTPGTTGYLAFSFIDGAVTDYGWARVSYNADFSLTLHDFAYDASGASILAGDTGVSAIPEPSTCAAFAGLFAAAAVIYARRRQHPSSALAGPNCGAR